MLEDIKRQCIREHLILLNQTLLEVKTETGNNIIKELDEIIITKTDNIEESLYIDLTTEKTDINEIIRVYENNNINFKIETDEYDDEIIKVYENNKKILEYNPTPFKAGEIGIISTI